MNTFVLGKQINHIVRAQVNNAVALPLGLTCKQIKNKRTQKLSSGYEEHRKTNVVKLLLAIYFIYDGGLKGLLNLLRQNLVPNLNRRFAIKNI